MSSAQASFLAKQGLSMLYNATVTSVSAISSGISMAYKSYADHYEKSQIETLRKNAKPPADVLYQVLIRFYYLSMAGYNNEVAAAAQKVAAKLTAGEKSSVTLESVGAVSHVLVSTCTRYGDFSAGGWGLQDFLNSSRMGKDHFDRDQLVNDMYFAILFAQDVAGGPGPEFEKIIREAAGKMIEGESFASDSASGFSSYTPSSALPSYAQVPAAMGSSTKSSSSSFGSASSSLSETDPKKRAAKVLNAVATSIKKAVDEAEGRRIRSLKDAEDMLRREKEKAAMASGAPAPASGGYSFGAAPAAAPAPASSFGSSAKSATAFGSGSSTGFGAKPASGFGSATPAAPAAPAASSGWASFGSSGGTGGASGGSSGFGSGGSGFGTSYGSGSSAGGFGSSGGYSSLAPPPSGGASTGGSNSSGANFLGL